MIAAQAFPNVPASWAILKEIENRELEPVRRRVDRLDDVLDQLIDSAQVDLTERDMTRSCKVGRGGGTIRVESDPGEWVEFIFTLPEYRETEETASNGYAT